MRPHQVRAWLAVFASDDRADAIGNLRLFASLFVGAVVIFIVSEVTAPLFAEAKEDGSGQVATQGTTWLQEFGSFLPIMFLLIAFFGVIAYGVFKREVSR